MPTPTEDTLDISSTYEVAAVEPLNDAGEPLEVTLSNLVLAVESGDAATVEEDTDATDNKQNIVTSDVVGATATISGKADGSDGGKYTGLGNLTLTGAGESTGSFRMAFTKVA